ncbi:unnamed protein product [Cylindrotheca closterium]|uniref:Guanylate cyclase domain-containing protein n=1 Tax=Cylindrotheca closterium TaxID=2856 RepID=A0AAD2FI38_9STRA|nr:unnamed protein product [Cylindrotheca closterium]
MESLSLSDKIQCSEPAAKMLHEQAPDLPLRRRGKVAVKGKGNMVTYWVGERPSARRTPNFKGQPMVNFAGDIVTPSPIPGSLLTPSPRLGRFATNALDLETSRTQDSKKEIETPPEATKEAPHRDLPPNQIRRNSLSDGPSHDEARMRN